MSVSFDGVGKGVTKGHSTLGTSSLGEHVLLVDDEVGRKDAALALGERVLGG